MVKRKTGRRHSRRVRKAPRRESGKLALVLGTSGVGKNAVVAKALEGLNAKCAVVNFGDITQRMVGDRDKFRRESSLAEARKMQVAVAKELARMVKKTEGILLVTSHSVLFRESGFWPGFPKWVLDELDVNLVALVTALPEEIAARKAADNSAGITDGRTRDSLPLEAILAQQEASRGLAYAYSMYSGAPFKEIVNRQGQLEASASQLRAALEKL